jgi:hypothetical protein
MSDRLLTVRALTNPSSAHAGPGAAELRALDRELRRRLAMLDARVDRLLQIEGAPSDEQVAEVDVLCAAITEAQELLEEARAAAHERIRSRRARRARPRRWA